MHVLMNKAHIQNTLATSDHTSTGIGKITVDNRRYRKLLSGKRSGRVTSRDRTTSPQSDGKPLDERNRLISSALSGSVSSPSIDTPVCAA